MIWWFSCNFLLPSYFIAFSILLYLHRVLLMWNGSAHMKREWWARCKQFGNNGFHLLYSKPLSNYLCKAISAEQRYIYPSDMDNNHIWSISHNDISAKQRYIYPSETDSDHILYITYTLSVYIWLKWIRKNINSSIVSWSFGYFLVIHRVCKMQVVQYK